jgi:hypothetical protein
MVDADAFYRTMSKPEPPRPEGVLGAAQAVQEKPSAPPPANAARSAPRDVDATEGPARRFYGHQEPQDRAEPSAGGNVSPKPEAATEPPDGPDDGLTAPEKDEQRRAAELEMAERMFGDLPNGDGVRYDEPELTSPTEFSLEVPDDLAGNLAEGESAQITAAFIDAGVGRTMANDLLRQGIEAARNGPMHPGEIEQRNAAGMAELQAKWGDQTPAKLEMAKDMIRQASARWPGLPEFLERSGLGSDVKLIKQLVARAERRPGRKST